MEMAILDLIKMNMEYLLQNYHVTWLLEYWNKKCS